MGLFKFLKEKLFKKKEKKEEEVKQAESIEKYDKGMAKSRKEFSSKLDELTKKYKVVNEDYFNELEEILIEADCGVCPCALGCAYWTPQICRCCSILRRWRFCA